MDFATCAPNIDPVLMQQVVRVESGGNPFAIGVVGGRLERQPKTLAEAVSTVRFLERAGYNYSIGTSQINRIHFGRLGWKENIATGFDVCANLKAGAGVLEDCHRRAKRAGYATTQTPGMYTSIHAALSCYYSGHFEKGAQLGYVAKVLGVSAKWPNAEKKGRIHLGSSMFVE
ncbi:lytic transglycosylase domain-containing protein [Delftia sp. GW456-R20]|uniref:lytic transglycosylase domain-containing protein n=1 Tax=Delftia sp. GW456-R20 TaxID=1827145 RepID=UPI0009EF2DC7|nr:lytic transglycosylase domain-containing protein [Delftia sp. GW456-R20]